MYNPQLRQVATSDAQVLGQALREAFLERCLHEDDLVLYLMRCLVVAFLEFMIIALVMVLEKDHCGLVLSKYNS